MSFELQTEIARKVIDLRYEEQKSDKHNDGKINNLLALECMLAKDYKTKSFFGYGLAKMYDLFFYVNLFFTGIILAMLFAASVFNGVNQEFWSTFILFTVIFVVSIVLAFFAKRKNKLSFILILISAAISFNMVLIILALMTVFKLKDHPFMKLSHKEKKAVREIADQIKMGKITDIDAISFDEVTD